jgi:hypothetical protein
VLANSPDASSINASFPRFVYTNRHGHVLDLTYGYAGKIDGVSVDYQSWPMLEDPWMFQSQRGHLHVFGEDRNIVSNYYNWTTTIQPLLSTWDTWLASHFSPAQLADPDITGPLRDADGDGLSNLAEYALGGNPASASDCPKPEFSMPEPVLLRMSFRRERSGRHLHRRAIRKPHPLGSPPHQPWQRR